MKKLEGLSDSHLLQLVEKGDKQAFGCLYQRYLNDIYRFVFVKTGDKYIAEDLTEETFIRTWERLKTAKKNQRSISHVRAWFYQIANNLVIDYYRKKKPVRSIESFIQSDEDSPEEVIEFNDMSETLLQCIRELKPKFQQIIILRFINELSHEETASIMKISTANSRVLQFRALKSLQDSLSKKGGQYG